jgi:hypothetical protein
MVLTCARILVRNPDDIMFRNQMNTGMTKVTESIKQVLEIVRTHISSKLSKKILRYEPEKLLVQFMNVTHPSRCIITITTITTIITIITEASSITVTQKGILKERKQGVSEMEVCWVEKLHPRHQEGTHWMRTQQKA